MPGMEAAGNSYVDLTDIMMVTVTMTIYKLNQTSGTFTDQPNSRGAFLSSDCLDKPKQVPNDCIAGQLENYSLELCADIFAFSLHFLKVILCTQTFQYYCYIHVIYFASLNFNIISFSISILREVVLFSFLFFIHVIYFSSLNFIIGSFSLSLSFLKEIVFFLFIFSGERFFFHFYFFLF